MATFVCPNQYRHNAHRFLMCKNMLGGVGNIQDTQDALKAYCPHQKHCSCTGGAENTDQARECYQKITNQAAKAD